MTYAEIKKIIHTHHFQFSVIFILLVTIGYIWWSWQQQIDQHWKKAKQEHNQLAQIIAQLPTTNKPYLSDESLLSLIQVQPLAPALVGHITDMQKQKHGVKARIQSAPAIEFLAWIKGLTEQGADISELTLDRASDGTVSGMIVFGGEAQ